jgi:hypothetical protein
MIDLAQMGAGHLVRAGLTVRLLTRLWAHQKRYEFQMKGWTIATGIIDEDIMYFYWS